MCWDKAGDEVRARRPAESRRCEGFHHPSSYFLTIFSAAICLSVLWSLLLPLMLLLTPLCRCCCFFCCCYDEAVEQDSREGSGGGAGSEREAGAAADGRRLKLLRVFYPPTDVAAYAEREHDGSSPAAMMGEGPSDMFSRHPSWGLVGALCALFGSFLDSIYLLFALRFRSALGSRSVCFRTCCLTPAHCLSSETKI